MRTLPPYRTEDEFDFDRYQVGGSLIANAPSYVERRADRDIYEALKRGEFCYVLNSRQMGKSSLMVRTQYHLEREGFKCATLDMTNIGSENITPLQWYKGLTAELWSGFQLRGKVQFKAWWQEQGDIPLIQKFSRFISEVLFVQFPHERLFVFVDEIDSILSLDFSVDDFFALIRFCYNQRALNPDYYRITFGIFGVATPPDLIQDKTRTPFNIGTAIELDGFTLEQSQPLTRGFQLPADEASAVLQEILAWTGGQPFLTQKLCQFVARELQSGSPLKIQSVEFTIENLVRSRIIQNWESQDHPEHLRTIRDRLLRNERGASRLLGLYQQILAGEAIGVNESPENLELLLSGLVANQHGRLEVKNRIYQAVFNPEWVAKQLENLRPYALQLEAWRASNPEDNSQLLQGIALQAALAWSQNKKLSDLDYRFLAASQERAKRTLERNLAAEKLEREKAQFALQAAKKAHLILAEAQKTARRKAKNLRPSKRWLASITLGVAGLVLLARGTGGLQGLEWMMLDRFFQARPAAAIDPRLAIVTIDEPDIQAVRQYPLPDRVLVQAIEKLKTYQPRLIGLDLYRDLPVEPGHQDLERLYKTMPNLIGIEKVVGSRIAPPPVLEELERVGFADQVLDGDGKVRRALLSIRPPDGKLRYSFSLQLALRYLEAEGITPKPASTGRKGTMQLGKARLVPFRSNDGGYVQADDGGYQVLLNFRGTQEQFKHFSMMDLLAGRVPTDAFRDRIVLIGATAQSLNDLFQGPYSDRFAGTPQQMAGVTLHANTVSQLLSAALDERPLLRVWREPVEWLWMLLWCGVGAGLSWRLESLRRIVAGVVLAGVGLLVVAYAAFLGGWWIPVVPAWLGLGIAAIALPIATNRQLEQIQLRQTVELLAAMTEEHPTAGQIAIEYLKQGESPEDRAAIERWVRELERGKTMRGVEERQAQV